MLLLQCQARPRVVLLREYVSVCVSEGEREREGGRASFFKEGQQTLNATQCCRHTDKNMQQNA